MRSLALFMSPVLLCLACSGSGEGPRDLGPVTDSGDQDTGMADTGGMVDMGPADQGTPTDAGPDAGPMDMDPTDMGPTDMGMPGMQALLPGMGVTVNAGTIRVGMDGFSEVTALLGAGTRSVGVGIRSYQWNLPGGGELTVWFANSNLDADDDAPNDVDDTDKVLWIAVTNGFLGKTPGGLGLGNTRAEVEAMHGAANHEVGLDNPVGQLAQYFTGGMLVTYDPQNNVRTWTINRAYAVAPDGALDPDGSRIRLTGGDIRGFRSITQQGTRERDVRALLGEPDAEGTVRLGGQDLDTLSYGFIGIEVFYLSGSSSTLFVAVHAPYYGTLPGGATVGSTRAAMDAELGGMGYTGRNSSMAGLICYGNGNEEVGVTFSNDNPPVATSISIPLLSCP